MFDSVLFTWLQFTIHTDMIVLFSLKMRYLYIFFMNGKSSQMTHFSCNIPYTAQVYSGKPREGQYSRHHDIKEGSETKPTKRISRETTVLASITFNTSLNRIAQL